MKREVILLGWLATWAVGACGTSGDAHDHSTDAGVTADGTTVGTPADEVGSADAACSPACTGEQICCLDVHGHNPTCQAGPRCP